MSWDAPMPQIMCLELATVLDCSRREEPKILAAGLGWQTSLLICLCVASSGIVISSPKELQVTNQYLWQKSIAGNVGL